MQVSHARPEPGSQAPTPRAVAARSGEDANRPLILAVEDNPHDWEIYGKMLWYNGYDVMHAIDGEAGLRLARELRPSLVLLDLIIPKIDGLDLCRLLQDDAATARIPVLILSSHDRKTWEPRARAVGCTGYLAKPIGPVDVLHEVERLVGRAPPAGLGRPPRHGSPVEPDESDIPSERGSGVRSA